MSWLQRTFANPIGTKVLVALSGLGLVGFLVSHLLGNLTVYGGPDALNAYADNLHAIPGFAFIELGLAGLFVLHIGLVAKVVRANRAARGDRGYDVSASKQSGTMGRAVASAWMGTNGILLLVFLVVHLKDFRFSRGVYESLPGGLAQHTTALMSQGWRVGLYVVGTFIVGWHLWHGFQSAFRSLGLGHGKYSPLVEKAGAGLAVVLSLGFASIPIWLFLTGGK